MSRGPIDAPPDQGGPPPEIRQQIIERGAAALEGFVEPGRRGEAVSAVLSAMQAQVVGPTSVQQMQITATQHVGPMPTAETAAQYEQILPGSTDRMFAMAERDQAAMIESNRRAQLIDGGFRIASLLTGAGGLVAILYVIDRLAVSGHENVAIAVAGLGISGVIGAFVNARMSKSE